MLRAFTGFAMAGAFMVIESWLNERATNENRGTVFGLYMMVTYASIMAGQMIVAAGDVRNGVAVHGHRHLLLPVAASRPRCRPPPTPSRCRTCRSTSRGSTPIRRSSFVACLLIGVANGAWGTLGAVYGARIGISTAEIALMMSLVVVAGAAMQMPIGPHLRQDRPPLRAGRRLVRRGAVVGVLIFLVAPRSGMLVIAMTAAYGALAYTLYSLAVAHANDHASAGGFRQGFGRPAAALRLRHDDRPGHRRRC